MYTWRVRRSTRPSRHAHDADRPDLLLGPAQMGDDGFKFLSPGTGQAGGWTWLHRFGTSASVRARALFSRALICQYLVKYYLCLKL